VGRLENATQMVSVSATQLIMETNVNTSLMIQLDLEE